MASKIIIKLSGQVQRVILFCRVTNVKHFIGTQTKSRDRWASIVASYLGIVSFDEHENSL